ncbi:MAG: tetratricopeptide repeat protein [Deltaproteobacteria bacterium]|nr:tetratricopeptide repeat protein [Deltaproteobacteria bacterium]
MTKPFWTILTVVGLLMATGSAIAGTDADSGSTLSDGDRDRALTHFQKGEQRFSQKEYLLAIEHFKLAYQITQSPEILYNIAMCYEALQENELAVEHYNEYLRKGDAEDAIEVKEKIVAMGGTVDVPSEADDSTNEEGTPDGDSAQPDEPKNDKKNKTRLDHFAFELGMGPAFVLMTPDTGVTEGGVLSDEVTKNNYFSIDVLGHFFLNDWFAISGVIWLGPYMEKDKFISRDPKSHVGIGVGIGMKKQLKNRTSLFTNLLGGVCSIDREKITRRATWFAFDIRFGMNIMVTKKFELNLMAVAEGGPAMVIKPSGEDWNNGMLLSVGPRLGFTYSSGKK